LLEYVLAHEQPHPPQIIARERPRVGPADMPDTLIKIDVAPGVPTLYIDKDTRTPFPADAAIPIDQILAALEEFRQTGDRPTCVSWQESEVC
jgi:hypothetical protein